MEIYVGCCENRLDPLKMGRCQVRIMGLHTADKTILPTDELPWAYPMMPINSASISGIGWSPTGVVQGSWILCTFLDEDLQQPIMLGTIGGIPHTASAAFVNDATNDLVTTDEGGELVSATGDSLSTIIEDLLLPTDTGTVQTVGSRYKIEAIPTETDTVFYVKLVDTEVRVAKATFNKTTELYEAELIKPEQYTQEQYLPFTDINPKTFKTMDEMATYFDTYF